MLPSDVAISLTLAVVLTQARYNLVGLDEEVIPIPEPMLEPVQRAKAMMPNSHEIGPFLAGGNGLISYYM